MNTQQERRRVYGLAVDQIAEILAANAPRTAATTTNTNEPTKEQTVEAAK